MYRKLLLVAKTLPSLSILAFGSFVVVAPLTAQTHAPIEPRVTQAVDSAQLVTLRGNTHPLAQARFDAGAAPASLPAERLLLILKRSDKQEADLQQFLASVQDPKSANYRKFLTPEQFGQSYGVADPDIAAVSSWLRGQGFLVTKVNKAKTVVEFSGNAGQVQNAFRTSIRSYVVNGEHHYANASDPKIPAALAPVVAGITGLNDFRPRPYAVAGPVGQYDPSTHQIKPQLTATGAAGNFLYVGPADAATIYNSPNSKLNVNFQASGIATSYDGTGVTIGVAGDSNINTADVDHYRSLFGLSVNTPTVVIDGQDPGINADSDEALLDTQIAGALAPGAHVNLYISADTVLQSGLFLSILRAVDDNAVDILNVSFGNCEFHLAGANQTLAFTWEQAAAQGISVTVSTGDNGSAACDDASTQATASNGLAINGFASTPYNIAVGGTDFDVLAANFSKYVASTNAGPYLETVTLPIDPGTSSILPIPENPWNNSTEPNTAIAANVAFKDSNGVTNIVAAGGGASNCSNVNTDSSGNPVSCLNGYAKPSWQEGLESSIGETSDHLRDVPDVSLFASNGFYSAAWAVCRDNDCMPTSAGSFSIHGFGGTSTSAPAFAGILALVSQSVGSRLGQANNVLYPLAKQFPGVFRDVTVGDISVPCDAGTADCGANSFLSGYDATTSYDMASGLGSVDIAALVKDWPLLTFTPTSTTLTLNGSNNALTIQHGDSVAVTSTVAASSGAVIPTGDVAIVTDDPAASSAGMGVLTLDALGSATGNINYFPGSATLPGGTYHVTARYAGDALFSSSTSTPITITVTSEDSVLNFGVLANAATVTPGFTYPYGVAISAFVQPAGVSAGAGLNGIATGTATFTDNGSPLATLPLNSNGVAEYDSGAASVGNHSLAVSYSGDASFNKNSAGPVAFSVSQGATATSVSSSDTSVVATDSVALTVHISTQSFGAGPSGTVNFMSGSTQVGTASITPTDGSPIRRIAASALATAIVPAGSLLPGDNSITAVYAGDVNYTTSTSGAITVTVTPGFKLVAGTPAPPTVAAGTSTSATITITPAGGFTGSITFACTVTGTLSTDIHIPTCSAASVTVPTGSSAAVTTTATVSTTAATTAALHLPAGPNPGSRWLPLAGGAALACVVFFGIPARRRSWRAMLGMVVFLAALTLSGCGGGGGGSGSGGGGGGNTQPGTSADTYTAKVVGTDSTGKVTNSVTFNFTVN